jgi:two-component system OmpR family response regulator
MNMFTNLFRKDDQSENTIFIVEDNELYAKSLQSFLNIRFPDIHRIKIFPVGELCLMELYQNPTVVIMDHMLNSKYADAASGLSIIKKIKAASDRTNIILLSAQKEFEVVSKAISKYGCTYLQKNEESFNKVEELVRKFFNLEKINQ